MSLIQTINPPTETEIMREVLPPDIKTTPLQSFPGLFKYFFEKNFFLKQELINLNAIIRSSLFPNRQDERVLKGAKGFYFLNGSEVTDYIQQRNPFDESTISAWSTYFDKIDRRLASEEIDFHLVLAPNKHDVYFDYLPSWLRIKSENTKRNIRLADELNPILRSPVIDLTDKLAQVANAVSEPLFFHTDTHWNEYGAAIGSEQILKTITTKGESDVDYEIKSGAHDYSGDLGRLLGLKNDLSESFISVIPETSPTCTDTEGNPINRNELDVIIPRQIDCKAPIEGSKLLVFTDSFGMSIIPSLAAAFPESRFVFSSYSVDFNQVKDFQPDTVLYLMVSRKLQTLDPKRLLETTFPE